MESLFKKISLVIFGLFLFQTSFSQENFKPGYIISLKGDTLRGFIDYRNWDRNPNKIFFKEKEADNKTAYSPLDISQFSVSNESYEGAIVEDELSPTRIDELNTNKTLIIKIDTTFLQTMINGIKSFYHYKDNMGKDLYYIKQNSKYELLVYKKYLKDQPHNTITVENKRYLGQLAYYLQDCPKVQSNLQDVLYSNESINRLFLFYYSCTQKSVSFNKKKEELKYEGGVLGGSSLTSIAFKTSSVDYANIAKSNFSKSLNVTGGIFLNIILPRYQGKWSIYNELTYSSFKTSGGYDFIEYGTKHTNYTATFDYSYLVVNNMVRFKFPVRNIFIFINAGISNGFARNEINTLEVNSWLASRNSSGNILTFSKNHELGYLYGLGTTYKKYSMELRYELGDGMSNQSSIVVETNRFFLLLSYTF